jgi:hypothetical protein
MIVSEEPQSTDNLNRKEIARAGSKKTTVDGSSLFLDDLLESLRERILREAHEAAKRDGRDDVGPSDIARAGLLFAPGTEFGYRRDIFGTLTRIGISGVTLMSCLLAAAFGLIGVFQTRAGNAQSASGAFDIAKIFAGAIVGSTGVAVAAASKRK